MDQFSIQAVDLGKLMKLKIRHDDSGGFNASWFLDRIEVKDVLKDEITIFHAERWLSKDKSKGQKIECNLYAKVRILSSMVWAHFDGIVSLNSNGCFAIFLKSLNTWNIVDTIHAVITISTTQI